MWFGNWMTYIVLVGTPYSKTLIFWKFVVIEEFFIRISFLFDAVIAFRVLTCPVMSLFKNSECRSCHLVSQIYALFCIGLINYIILFLHYVFCLWFKRKFTTSCTRTLVILYVVLWVEVYVIIMLRCDTGTWYIICDGSRYFSLVLFHVTVGSECSTCCYSSLSWVGFRWI